MIIDNDFSAGFWTGVVFTLVIAVLLVVAFVAGMNVNVEVV